MVAASQALMFVAAIFVHIGCVVGESGAFLGGPRSDHLALDEAFSTAMTEVVGCGDAVSANRTSAVERALRPIWEVLPKNRYDRVEWRLLRYMTHRYFMQQYSLLVRGMEPSRIVNETDSGIADVLGHFLPSKMEEVIEGKGTARGFNLDDAVLLVATIEQLIADQESTLLQQAYKYRRQQNSISGSLSHAELTSVIETYTIMWMVNENLDEAYAMLKDSKVLHESIPHWPQVSKFAGGIVKSLEFARERSALPGHGRAALTHKYSFDDAREAVSSITRSFASFWETECQRIKADLVEMDKDGTGRVLAADFYGANNDGEWRFGESEAYLRELGALDESSPSRGKQIIIPNYMQAASNCIVTTANYLVCCVNECEGIMNDIEQDTGKPVASPEAILPLVGNMTNWDDDAPTLDEAMHNQLHHIAQIHGGRVPIHGRLFAQWLHYAFPRECPFPHKTGYSSTVTPSQFGDEYIATEEHVTTYAAHRSESLGLGPKATVTTSDTKAEDATQWMSQWSEDEELIADYSAHLGRSSEFVRRIAAVFGVSSILAMVWGMWFKTSEGVSLVSNPDGQKIHFV